MIKFWFVREINCNNFLMCDDESYGLIIWKSLMFEWVIITEVFKKVEQWFWEEKTHFYLPCNKRTFVSSTNICFEHFRPHDVLEQTVWWKIQKNVSRFLRQKIPPATYHRVRHEIIEQILPVNYIFNTLFKKYFIGLYKNTNLVK